MATIDRIGFGQVEPNHLSAQITGQIYAQLPADDFDILENGMFVKYDYTNGKIDLTGVGEWMLVFNEVKLYDDRWRESYKDFAMIKTNYTSDTVPAWAPRPAEIISHDGVTLKGQMVPRVFKTNVGDIFTTNCLEQGNTSGTATVTGTDDLSVGSVLAPNSNGFLETTASTDGMLWKVVKIYKLADGQDAVKIQRVQ